ncbi:hypothetical protein [Turneriella parva]|uniref:Uncharacterized protein n=1 Tax=Turneriella parva (strain ATCC BAA-1111 / DSM 21527 / NCTC 11395 / H) TaxID=869212 RepID=I4B682_TURPD|nr:hypothetical protein [Turneriella parva]AFM12789.1 hypothetical protein Turpa_2143 [Turneriella parva DSM 21527]
MATNKFEAAKENSWPLLKNCLIIFAIASIPGLAGGYIFLSHRSFWQQAEATKAK